MKRKSRLLPRVSRGLILPDVHAPFHNKRAVRLVRDVIEGEQPDTVISLGDFADNLAASGHQQTKAQNLPSIAEELAEARIVLHDLVAGIPERHFIMGNHETRLNRYIAKNAPALRDWVSVEEALGLDSWDTVTQYNETLRLGKVCFTHDLGEAGANAHRSAVSKYMACAVIGHTHRMAYEVFARQDDLPVVGAMFGWLGDADKVDYLHRVKAKQWPLGFGWFLREPTGVMHITPVPIIDYKCVVAGTIYSG